MQGLVTLDFGNTHPHAGLFQKVQGSWQLVKVVPMAELSLFLSSLDMTANNTSVVLASVKDREELLAPLIEQGFLLTRLKDYWRGDKFAGMPVNYAVTLGEDRLIEAYAAFKKFKVATLVIDAGTYVTMDVVTTQGFQGGYILPGLETYFNMFQQADQLKNVPLEHDFSLELPQKTSHAMTESYTAFASLARELCLQNKIEKVILTGGKTDVWRSFLKFDSDKPVIESEPHFIHHALHYWFTTQIEPL